MERKPEEKKGIFTKLKENIDDHDEQMAVLGAAVRLGVVIWSGQDFTAIDKAIVDGKKIYS